jgi:hypothetical protein
MAGSDSRSLTDRIERPIATGPLWNQIFPRGPARYADGAVGTPNPPIPKGQNPFFEWDTESGTFKPIPGSPADRSAP